MPTTLDLIRVENLASIIFIISSFQSLFSGFKAEQVELEKNRNPQKSSGSNPATVESIQLALDSTWTATLAYLIFLITAEFRKEQLEQQIKSGTTNVSITPNILLISGFSIAVIAGIIRLPAIEQRLAEAQRPVVL